jgi:hypothetical protein
MDFVFPVSQSPPAQRNLAKISQEPVLLLLLGTKAAKMRENHLSYICAYGDSNYAVQTENSMQSFRINVC